MLIIYTVKGQTNMTQHAAPGRIEKAFSGFGEKIRNLGKLRARIGRTALANETLPAQAQPQAPVEAMTAIPAGGVIDHTSFPESFAASDLEPAVVEKVPAIVGGAVVPSVESSPYGPSIGGQKEHMYEPARLPERSSPYYTPGIGDPNGPLQTPQPPQPSSLPTVGPAGFGPLQHH